MEKDLVSIITASYNSAKYIAKTIEAVQAQTYTNWELLITDDCSTDGSREIVKKYAASDPRIKLLCLDTNSGAGIARNTSIKEARGRYIAFCDSDDRWTPEKLEHQLAFMKKGNHHLTYTSYSACTEEGRIYGIVKCRPRITYREMLINNGIGCLTAIYDAGRIGKVYMPSIRKRQDWCLWMSIIKEHGPAYGLDEPLAIYRDRMESISSGKVKLLKYNYAVYRQVLGYNAAGAFCMLAFGFLPAYFLKKIKQKFDSRSIR